MPTPDQMQRMIAVVPLAQQTQRRWHVPASIALAQWAFESAWGTSELTLKANNCFGVKATRDQPYAEFRTAEYAPGKAEPHIEIARFASYPSVTASFEAHGRFLCGARYAEALSYADDPHAFARALQRCGYSTDPKYASKLCALIDALNLTQYDLPVIDPLAGKRTV